MGTRKDEYLGRKRVQCCQNVSLLLFRDMMTLRKGWRTILQLAFFYFFFSVFPWGGGCWGERLGGRTGGNEGKEIKYNLFFLVYVPALA